MRHRPAGADWDCQTWGRVHVENKLGLSATNTGGPPHFLAQAPEVLDGNKATAAGDVYSFGVVGAAHGMKGVAGCEAWNVSIVSIDGMARLCPSSGLVLRRCCTSC